MRGTMPVNFGCWLDSIRFYLVVVRLLNGVWEVVQPPLYALWHIGSTG
jgi:hypothetical protein